MTKDELREIIEYLRGRVILEESTESNSPRIAFNRPTGQEMKSAGLNMDGVKRLLRVPWWNEMVNDIVETPDMCGPDDPPDCVLEYARDVVSEYIWKRFPLTD